ncbi:MAG: microcin ABC transporter permease, partial [Pseudomonadota bacterium]
MGAYILKRLGLMIPTLIGIILVNFIIIQFAPGGPVEQVVAELRDGGGGALDRIGGGATEIAGQGAAAGDSLYRGSQGIDPEFIAELERQFGLDRPVHERFLVMVYNYFTFDFGESFFKKQPVIDLIIEKLPVSLTLGFWTLLLSYTISIPLGIRK